MILLVRLLAFILIAVLPAAAVLVYDQDGPHLRLHVAAALVLGAVLGLLVAWLSRRRFVHEPLRRLIAFANALRGGHYPPRGVMAAVAGEFAPLARALADMAAALAAREAALRESEQRFRRLSDASFEGVAIHDGERIIETNAAAARLFGYEPQEVVGMPLAALIAPETRAHALATARAEVETRYESVGLRKDGSTFPVEFRGRRIEHQGRPRRIVAIRDLTEQRNAAAALRESERLARARLTEIEAVYATAPVGLCVVDRNLRFVRINERKAAMHGYPPAAHIGRSIRELLPEVAARVEPLLRRVIETGEPLLNVEVTGETPAQPGVRRVWNESWFPLRDHAGRVIAVNVVAEEITERKRAEERLKLLAAEVDHRAKNMLALVQVMLRHTRAATVQEYAAAASGRVSALARAHTLLSESRWEGADLEKLVQEEIAPFRRTDGKRIQVSGPPLDLSPRAAQAFAMALHELTTNAAKHGALSVAQGRVAVDWAWWGDGRLALRWTETGGPSVQAPTSRGLGMNVIERSISQQLDGEVRFHWRPEGLMCELVMPASKLTKTAG